MNGCFHILNAKLCQDHGTQFALKVTVVGTANRSARSVKTRAFPESLHAIDSMQSLLDLVDDQHIKAR
jgi:hypothetical protein